MKRAIVAALVAMQIPVADLPPIPKRASEAEHRSALAEKYDATEEFRLWDGTRVDLLNESEAIEIDFAPKWAESIGQALYYSTVTGRKPAIILLADDDDDRFCYRAQTVCARVGIKLYIEEVIWR